MSPSGSLAGRKRERFAHSTSVYKPIERLALAHAACGELVRSETPYAVALTELARKLPSTLCAQAVAVHEAFAGGETATSLDGEAGSQLRALCLRFLGSPPPARVIVLSQPEEGAPFPAVQGLDTVIVVPLVLPRGEAVLAIGWAGALPNATEDLICSRILGDHLALAMAAGFEQFGLSQHCDPNACFELSGGQFSGDQLSDGQGRGDPTSPIDEFVSMTAHELRTPLTPITMLLQSLERKAKNGTVDLEAILRTRKQVQRLTVMISDLLDCRGCTKIDWFWRPSSSTLETSCSRRCKSSTQRTEAPSGLRPPHVPLSRDGRSATHRAKHRELARACESLDSSG